MAHWHIPHPFGIVARSLPLRFALLLALLLVFIINAISFSSRGADFCACYSPPSSPLDDIQLISSVCGFGSTPSSSVIVCKHAPLANGDVMCNPSPPLADLQAARAACGAQTNSRASDGGSAAPPTELAFLSTRIAKFGSSIFCRRLGLGCTSVVMHMAAYVDYQMSGWDAVHHMAAFADLRRGFCQQGGCSDAASNFGELLDIGCNLGGISLAAAANGFDSVCVEALPSNARRIAATISLNSHLPGHINMYNIAVGDGNTEAKDQELHFDTNKGNGQALTASALSSAVARGAVIQSVRVAAVDSIITNKQLAWKPCPQSVCNRFFVMKIDVEGFELRALRGSASLFKHAAPPVIMIELAPGTIKGYDGPNASKELIDFFVFHGYRLAVENVIACHNANCNDYLEAFGDADLDAAVDLKRCSMGKTAVQDLSAALTSALGNVQYMKKHFCELDLNALGLRYLDRVEALTALTNAVLWHPQRLDQSG